MQPTKQSSIWTVDQDSRTLSNYRSARNIVRWAYLDGYLSGVFNILLGLVLYADAGHQGTLDIHNFEYVSGILTMVLGIIVLFVSFFVARRSRIAAGISIGFAIFNTLVLLYFFLQGGKLTGVFGTGLYLYFNIRAYNSIPDVLAYEQRAKS